MTLPPLNLAYVLAAVLPLLVVLFLMIGRGWGGSKAGPAGWLTSVLVSVIVFGANIQMIMVATGRSLLLAFFVLYIIWMALLLYHVVDEAGAIQVIGQELPALARDKPSQALLLGWVFGSFLQGASGFGVPAAVVAPLLVGLGFAANPAVVIALVGHAWAVTFGSLGSSFFSLIAATGEPGTTFAGSSAMFLGLSCFLCGFAVLWESGRGDAIKKRWGQLLGIGLIMATTQYVLAVAGLWSLAAFGAGLAGLIFFTLDLRFGFFDVQRWHERLSRKNGPKYSGKTEIEQAQSILSTGQPAPRPEQPKQTSGSLNRSLTKALVPYLLLTLIVVAGQLLWKESLSIITLDPFFPEVATSFGWRTPAGPGRAISLFGHAGALLFYTSLLSYIWFRWQGTFRSNRTYKATVILRKTIKGSTKSTIGIITLVAMAVTMQHAGMTQLLAQGLSIAMGPTFPFLSPFIGALGAFMTGSNTNSNVVFGSLQLDTAVALGTSVALILATQTAGGAIGSLFAPAKVIVGCSTVEGAKDSQVLKRATIYGLAIIAVLGLVASALLLLTR
jgi:lactate permease